MINLFVHSNKMTEFDLCTPVYRIEEKNEEIVLTITAPLSKPREAAFVLEKNVFTFESSPYRLKVKLPHPVSDRFSNQAYDDETKTYRIKLKKVYGKPEEESSEDDEFNQEFKDLLKINSSDSQSSVEKQNLHNKQYYGFANRYSNMFGNLYNEFSEVISLPNPDSTSVEDRRKLRLEEENEKWDDDHYLADTMEADHFNSIFKYKPPWIKSHKEDLDNDEKEILSNIKSTLKSEQLSEENIMMSEFQIIDILFGYAYNKRTTEGDNTVESGWTINKLSSTLSWFEVFEDLKTVILTCYKRSLTYPLYRNWNLAQAVHRDVVNILKKGPKQVTCCLIEVIEIFNDSENRYLLNTLYINELCNFAYNMTQERSNELALELEKIKLFKYEVNSDIPILEVAGHLALEEGENGNDEMEKINNIIKKIEKTDFKNDSCSDSSDSYESDTESSDSSQLSNNEN